MWIAKPFASFLVDRRICSTAAFLCFNFLFFYEAESFSDEKRPVSIAPNAPVNYPSNFQVENGVNVLIYGDYLYWIAQEDNLRYAHTELGTGTVSFPSHENINFDGHLKKVKPRWDSGSRIGLGLNFPQAGYDLIAYWTWFSTSAFDSISKGKKPLFSLSAHPDNPATSIDLFAQGKWNLDIQLFDLEWGRSSWFGGRFSLRPFFGIRSFLLDQHLKSEYVYDTFPVTVGKLRSESDFHGGGLRAGADLRFSMEYGFSIYGVVSGSLLYGRFDANFRLKQDQELIARAKDHFSKGISSLQLALGLGWDTHFAKDRLHLEFHAGWEQNQWFSIPQMNPFIQEIGKGIFLQEDSHFSLQGLVVGGRFDF